MTTSPRPRLFSPTLLPAAAGLGLLLLGACNAIFGIEEGLPLGNSTTEGAGAGGSTSSGAGCNPAPAPAKGLARQLLVSTTSIGYEQGNALVHDSADNVLAAGFFNGGAIDLGKPLSHLGTGMQDGFVVKLDPQGAYLWGHAFGGDMDLRLNGVGTDAAGNVYVTGAFNGAATSGEIDLTAAFDSMQSMTSLPDTLVISLDPTGQVRWAKRFGNPLTQRGFRIAVDAQGNSYVAGTSEGKVDFGDGSGMIGESGKWSFFLKLDPSGSAVWAQSIGGFPEGLPPDNDAETFDIALTLDGQGHLIIGGAFQGQTAFGADLETAVGDIDAFVASLDVTDGQMLWHRLFHQPQGDMDPDGNQWITALAVEPCSGDIYAAGGFTEGVDFDPADNYKVSHGNPTDQDMFLVKLAASDGTPRWSRAYGDSGVQAPTAVKVAPDGTVLFTGFLINGMDPQGLDCGEPIGYLPPVANDLGGTSDLFLLKLDSQGNGLWGVRRGDTYAQAALDVSVSSKGDVALVGVTAGTLALGGSTTAQMSSDVDAFLARFDP